MNVRHEVIGNCELYLGDCMELMAALPDKSIDLAIVDPPYGIGENWKHDSQSPFYTHESSYKNERVSAGYFEALFRVSTHQIIWGGNYYAKQLEERNSWVVWDKAPQNGRLFNSDCELAWTSFNTNMKIARFVWDGFNTCEPRYSKHPHEKPVALYKWLLGKYAKPGWKILDTHFGGGSIAIACNELGFELIASEIDAGYFEAACRRTALAAAQGTLDFGI